MIQLSILIPTVVGREEQLDQLVQTIYAQMEIGNEIEIIVEKDDKEMTVGEKRNLLYQQATGLYSFMPDDDDSIAPDFIKKVLRAIKTGPDCITYYERVDIDGEISKSNHSLLYSRWHDNPTWPEGFKYARTPYFKDVIRTDIAKSVPVPFCRWGEDNMWADLLQPHLKFEYHIDEFMYFYKTVSSNPTEKYGLDR